MLRKILAAVLAAMMLVSVATSCNKKEPAKESSSKKPTSSVESIVSEVEVESDIVSSEIAQVESEEPEESNPYSWTIETKSAFFRDTDEAKQSVSKSETIKQYKNPGTYMIGCYQLRMGTLDAYGADIKSRAKEFEDTVKQGYFNTFLLSYDPTTLVYELPIIAENGGTYWLGIGRLNTGDNDTAAQKEEKYKAYEQKVQEAVNYVKKLGYYELLNGFYYDEPIWTGQKNEDFLKQTEINYKKFGLRNFPVFATGEFSDEEGNAPNLGVEADQMKKVLPESCKYLTDVAFDSYNIDVRPEAKYTEATFERWETKTGNLHECTTGMDYYIAYKKRLLNYIGHPANFYYYPCAYGTKNVQGGLTGLADEGHCTAHAEYMAADLLNDKSGGGIIMYTFPSGSAFGLDQKLPIKDKNGFYTMYPEVEKWETYAKALQNIRKKFDATKQTIQYK